MLVVKSLVIFGIYNIVYYKINFKVDWAIYVIKRKSTKITNLTTDVQDKKKIM